MIRAIVAWITLALFAPAIRARPRPLWQVGRLVPCSKNMPGASCCDISHAHYLQEKDWRSDGERPCFGWSGCEAELRPRV